MVRTLDKSDLLSTAIEVKLIVHAATVNSHPMNGFSRHEPIRA